MSFRGLILIALVSIVGVAAIFDRAIADENVSIAQLVEDLQSSEVEKRRDATRSLESLGVVLCSGSQVVQLLDVLKFSVSASEFVS